MEEQFYQVGGTLPPYSRSYIQRETDEQLYNNLKKGLYCYVLNARQVGKSSLRVFTAKRFQNEGYFCIHIDFSAIGQTNTTEKQWYESISDSIVEQLFFDELDFLDWYEKHAGLSAVNRFAKFIDKFILENISENIIIFIDEVDFILNTNSDFSTDDFFAVIRSFYNLRSENPKYNQLAFALFGVATPEDLMRDASRTPFNIAHNVTIEQFKIEESYSLVEGLGHQPIGGKRILKKIFSWTSGTPYLTQKILQHIAQSPIQSLDEIDGIVDLLFIQNNFNEVNISDIQKRILSNEEYNVGMLHIIGKIFNAEHILVDDKDLRHCYLQLSGLLKKDKGRLKYSNKIYKRVFNKQWLNDVLDKIDRPFAKDLNRWLELQKDSSALLTGEVLQKANEWAEKRTDLSDEEYYYLARSRSQERERESHRLKEEAQAKNIKWLTAGIFFMIILLGLTYFYSLQSDQQRQNAEKAKEIAEHERKEAEHERKEAEKAKEIAEHERKIANIERKKAEHERKNAELEKEKAKEKQKIVEEQKRKLIENQKRFAILEEAFGEKEECQSFDKNCVEKFIQRQLFAHQLLLPNDPQKHNNKIAHLQIELGDIYFNHHQKKLAIELYLKALRFYTKILENNNFKAFKKIAEISEKLGDSYQDINRSKTIYFYKKSLNFTHKKNKEERLYSKLSKNYFKKGLYRDAEFFYKKGFKQYKELLQKTPAFYIDDLAEKFFYMGKINQKIDQDKKAFHALKKALKLYKIQQTSKVKKKILEIKNTIRTLSYRKSGRKNTIGGWVYLGSYSNKSKTWEKEYFALKGTEPSLLDKKKFIALGTINVRERGSKTAKIINGLHLGDVVKIQQHNFFHKDDEEWVWAFIEY